MTNWKVLANPNVPQGMEALYAQQAVAQAEARAKAEQEEQEARMNHDQQIREALAANEAEGKKRQEKEAEEKAKKDRKRFEDGLREQFFANVPGATETDWIMNARRIIADAMVEAASGRGPVDIEKKRLLASGRYGF